MNDNCKMHGMMSEANAHSLQSEPTTAGEQAVAATSGIQDNANSNQAPSRVDEGSVGGDSPKPLSISEVTDIDSYEAMQARVNEILDNEGGSVQPQPVQTPQESGDKGGDAPVVATIPPEGVTGTGEGDESGKNPQFRVRGSTELDAEALRIYTAASRADAPIEMEQALQIAKQKLGIPEKAIPEAKPTQQSAEGNEEGSDEEDGDFNGLTQTQAKAELKALRKKVSEALRQGELDEAADFNDQIGDMEDLIEVLGEREQGQKSKETQARATAFQGSINKATEFFPDFAVEGSEFFKTCAEIDDALQASEDPRYYDANKPFLVAQMAARELNVAPLRSGKSAPAPQHSQTPTQQPTVANPLNPARVEKANQLPAASGSSRTASQGNSQPQSLAERISKVTTTDDFDRLAAAMAAV